MNEKNEAIEAVDEAMKEITLDGERVKAIVTIVIVAVVNVANVFGYAVDADAWVNVALSLLSALGIVWSWWKNQNITPEAVEGQKLLDSLKAAKHANADKAA